MFENLIWSRETQPHNNVVKGIAVCYSLFVINQGGVLPPWFNQIRKTLIWFQNLIADMTMRFYNQYPNSG